MFMHKTRLRDFFNKSSAIILSLLILISIITPLYVGMSIASAVANAKFQPGRTYYFYLGDAAESITDVIEKTPNSLDFTARFVSWDKGGEVVSSAKLVKTTTADNGTVDPDIAKYVYKVTMPSGTEAADAVYIRDLGVIPSTFTASPTDHVRLIFDAEQVDDLENPGFVTFDNPLISARDSRGNALTITDNGKQIITPYDPANGAYGAVMSDYVLTGNGASKSDYWWYVDIPEDQFDKIASVTFYSASSKGGAGGAVVTQELEPIRYGDFVFFRGTIPVDPHIYKFEASDASFSDKVTDGRYQNYFMVTEDSEMMVSKYTYPERFSSVPYHEVWVYNESWAGLGTVYASGDYNDPLNGTTAFTEDPNNLGWFKGSIPEEAALRFHPQADDDEKGASEITKYPKENGYPEGEAAYYMSNDYEDQWIKKSNAEEKFDYYAAQGTGFSSSDIYSVKATYYDYLSNQEMESGWRNNLPSLWSGDIWNGGDWGNRKEFADQFSNFNNAVMSVAQSDRSWRYPLYFGNFSDNNANKFLDPYWADVSNTITGINWNKFYSVQNSFLFGGNYKKPNAAVWGLMYTDLKKNYYGNTNGDFSYDLLVGNNGKTTAPYFDAEWLINKSGDTTGGSSTTTTKTYKIEVTKAQYNRYYDADRMFYEVKIPDVFDTILINNNGTNISQNISLNSLVGNVLGYYNNSNSGVYYLSGNQLNNCPIGKTSHGSDGYYYVMFMDETNASKFFNIHAWNSADSSNVKNGYPGIQVRSGASESVTITTSNSSSSYSGRRGYVVSSYFPFRTVTENGVTHYRFNSADSEGSGARGDVVNFTWENGVPKKVNYYNNTNKIRNAYNSEDREKNGNKLTTTSYGFYPFNTGNSSTWVNESNHDFGFATKMEMNFRLPENGVYSNGEHAKFTFTGDDDLWVYIDGKLVLDLGGAHSKASGTIDFGYAKNTIRATTSLLGLSVNENNSSSDTDHINDPWGTQNKDFTSIHNDDITEVHTMTIYYMERGLMDSNLSIDFSTMPANTAVRLEKDVETANVNDGFDVYTDENGDSISGYASRNDTFDFTLNRGTSVNSVTSSTAGFRYTLIDNVASSNSRTGSVASNNSVTLKDNQFVRFLNQFYANDYIKVVEANDTNNTYNYTTQVEVYDSSGVAITPTKLGSGYTTVKSGVYQLADNDRRVEFLLDGEGKNTATAIVKYTNIPETTDLVISTEILDDARNPVNRDARRFTYQLQAYVEGAWRNVPFDADIYLYTLSSDGNNVVPMTSSGERVYYETLISKDGKFSLSKYNKLIIHDLPVGMKYRITATRDVLYAPVGYYEGVNNTCDKDPTGAKQKSYGSGYRTAEFSLASSNAPGSTEIVTPEQGIAYANQIQLINMFSPSGASISAQKLLDDVKYSGDAGKFEFKAELVGGHITGLTGTSSERDLTSADAEKYKFTSTTVGVSATGDITWSSSSDTFDYPGDYIYKITEVQGTDSTYKYDTIAYYALVKNTGDGDPIVSYYKTYSGKGGESSLSNKITSPESLTNGVVFKNYTNIDYIDISFLKKDDKGTALAGAEFTLYTDENCTTAGISGTEIGGAVVSTKFDNNKPVFTNPVTSGKDGKVVFKGLDYNPGTDTSKPDKTYYIKETKTVSGHQLVPGVYKVEIYSNGTYKLYYNNTLVGSGDKDNGSSVVVTNNTQPELPKTGGIGVGIYYVIGAVILLMGVSTLVYYKKKEKTDSRF
ncbi:MAG: fibro-slime domain-containing protein [Ruminococcus sp.]|nr:fibro-slime domain-containing protein [Ruminococcus sp.]